MKRFYRQAGVEADAVQFTITLDGKPVRTPAGRTLTVSSERLAAAIASEWQAQEKDIVPARMPLTQIAVTVLDRLGEQRPALETEMMRYLDTDLLCYRAAHPPELAARQEAAFAVPLRWFAGRYGATLKTTTGLNALAQPQAAHEAVAVEARALDDQRFLALYLAVKAAGSLVLGLGLAAREFSADDVWSLMHMEEQHKAEIYGESLERTGAVYMELQALARFLSLLEAA